MAEGGAGVPPVSLVIPSRHGGTALFETIDAFAREGASELEIVVAECARDGSGDRITSRWPHVRVIHFDDERTIPELRAAGLVAARAAIVAMTGDRCAPGPGWLTAVRRAHADAPDAVGGAIENGSVDRLVDWAVYFCEYGRYMPPLAREPHADLPGQNVSYARGALDAIRDLVQQGTWEPLWHWRLAARGARLVRDPSRIVVLRKRFTFAGFMRERFHYGRSFAGQRVAGASAVRRALFAAGCLALPGLVLVRLGRDVLPKRRHAGRFLLCAPYFAAFACAWAAGEAAGYAAGPGASASAVD
ncbi:MAG TPA: hypothetical protein VF921_00695 [Vicinamibacterales bacterium]